MIWLSLNADIQKIYKEGLIIDFLQIE